MLANSCHLVGGHAYFPAVLERMPHSSINSALTRKAWYEDADRQAQISVLLREPSELEEESELAEHDRVNRQLEKDSPEAHKQLSALFDSEHLNDTVYALLDLLRRGDLPDFGQKDNDPFLTFINQDYYLAQSEAVKELIEVQVHLFEDCADKSERPEVRTIIEEALPAQVLEWLRTMRKHHLGPDLHNLLDEISKHKVDKQVIEERLVAFKQRMNMEAWLPACCCYGIRDDYLLEGDLEFIRAKGKGTRKPSEKQQEKDTASGASPQGTNEPDLFAQTGQKKSSYVKVQFCILFAGLFLASSFQVLLSNPAIQRLILTEN